MVLTAPFPKPLQPVTVEIGGKAAEVLYAGQAPQLVFGVTQLNIRIPRGLAAGPQPLTIHVGDRSTQTNLVVTVK